LYAEGGVGTVSAADTARTPAGWDRWRGGPRPEL